LDTSAVMAFALDEAGSEKVIDVLADAVVPAPNWAEVLDIARRRGRTPKAVGQTLKALGLWIEPIAEDDAEAAAEIGAQNAWLSLGDRLCLAVAERFEKPAYTADRAWANATTKAEVILIR
jgi:ribonuclease VapC